MLEVFGERTVDGFEGTVFGLGRFLVLRGWVGSGVFSLSSSAEKWSLGLLVPREGGAGWICSEVESAVFFAGLGGG